MNHSMKHRKTPPYGTGFDKAGIPSGSKAFTDWYSDNNLIGAVHHGGSTVSWK